MDALTLGRPIAILQNVVYALPARKCSLYTSDAAPTIQQCNEPTFAVPTVVTLVEGGYTNLGAGFIRCTTANITVTLKAD